MAQDTDTDLYNRTKEIVLLGLDQEKRWENVNYMPTQFADTVYEHCVSTKNVMAGILAPLSAPEKYPNRCAELLAAANEMIDWHDAPEAGGEYLIGDFEKAMRDAGRDIHALEIKNFTYIFYHAENAAKLGDPNIFLEEMERTKAYMINHVTFDGKNIDPAVMDYVFGKLDEYLSGFSMSLFHSKAFLKAMGIFEQIENDHQRKNDFPAAWAKMNEKNEAYVHMGRVFRQMAEDSSYTGPNFRRQKNARLIGSLSRNSLFFEDMMAAAQLSNDPFYKEVAKRSLRFAYTTEQNYLRYGPAYVSFAKNGIVEPEIDDADEHHERYTAEIENAYNEQPEDVTQRKIWTRQEVLLQIEAAKSTLTVPPPGTSVVNMPNRSEAFWDSYSFHKRKGLFAGT